MSYEYSKQEFGELFYSASAVLFRIDPIRMNRITNTDEYDPEVSTILPRLSSCSSVEDVLKVIHEEFLYWFSADIIANCGDAHYHDIAAELWQLWQENHQ